MGRVVGDRFLTLSRRRDTVSEGWSGKVKHRRRSSPGAPPAPLHKLSTRPHTIPAIGSSFLPDSPPSDLLSEDELLDLR